jgi:hypothetical protein
LLAVACVNVPLKFVLYVSATLLVVIPPPLIS